MSSDALARVQSQLGAQGYHSNGTGSMYRCPAHPDSKPSLSVTAGTEQPVVLYCHAGCSTEDVLGAIGLTMADITREYLPDSSSSSIPAPVHYRYTDEHGTVLYEKIRTYPKTFTQRRASMGGWVWKLGDVRRVLYNLPNVAAQIKAGGQVIYVEGEKDADRLISSGRCATTITDGAGHWRPEYTEVLRQAKSVLIIADNDDPGYQHAEFIRRELAPHVPDVRVVRGRVDRDHADVSDHLDAGYSLDQLLDVEPPPGTELCAELCADVPHSSVLQKYRFEDWEEIFAQTPDEVQWLREPVLEKGTLNVIYGDRGKGKSLFLLEQAALLATTGHTVLYVDNENRKTEYRDRLRDMGYKPADLGALKLLWFSDLPPLDTAEGGADLSELVTVTGAELVIVDTRSRFARGKENDSDTYINMYTASWVPLKRAGVTVVLLDHSGKDRSLGPRGSSAKGGDIDTEWEITAPKNSKYRYLECTKNRPGRVEEGFKVTLEKIAQPHFMHRWIWSYGVETNESATDRQDTLAEKLDELGCPKNAGRPTAEGYLVKAGIPFDTHILAEVIRTRKAVCHSTQLTQ